MLSKDRFRSIVRRVLGVFVYRTPPRGTDLQSDIRVALKHFDPVVVFDVGANVGQSTAQYLAQFAKAQIHAFEPVAATANELKKRFGGHPRVVIAQTALGDCNGDAFMEIAEQSVASHISANGVGEKVGIVTLDDYCSAAKVDRIGFLKIDTEGNDLAVLQGAENCLRNQEVDMIQVEAGMSPDNERHVRFEDIKEFLENRGYRLFALYEQVREFPKKQQNLRRVNPVFISQRLMDANRG